MSLITYLYIARCNDGTLYTGITHDLQAREDRHNAGLGAKYTAARRPIKIIYFETFPNLKEACKRECQIKNWKRNKKELLIQGNLH